MEKIFLLILVFTLLPIHTNAQSDVTKMLKDINGKIDEIVIKSEGKEFTFSGDEAEKLFSTMKNEKKVKSFSFISKDGKVFNGDSLKKKITVKILGNESDIDEKDVLVFIDENDPDDIDMNNIEKKVIVSDEDGEKVVKVIIKKDGKENIEVYEGKAAEEYLDKMKSEKDFDVKVDDESNCCDVKHKKIIIEKEVEKK